MRLFGVLVVLAGCHGSSGGMPTPDAAPDAGSDASGRLGLFVAWEAEPQLPGPLTNDVTVTDVEFLVKSLELLSDAGDPSKSNITLVWNSQTEPSENTFPTAPAGMYSQITIVLGGGTDSAYKILGTWNSDGGGGGAPRPFSIDDRMSLPIVLDCNKTLIAAGSTELAIKIDLRDTLSHVKFDTLEVDGSGASVLDDTTDPTQMSEFRARLPDAFKIDN